MREVEDRVDDITLGILWRSTLLRRLRHPGLDPLPLRIRQVGRVRLPAHAANNNDMKKTP